MDSIGTIIEYPTPSGKPPSPSSTEQGAEHRDHRHHREDYGAEHRKDQQADRHGHGGEAQSGR